MQIQKLEDKLAYYKENNIKLQLHKSLTDKSNSYFKEFIKQIMDEKQCSQELQQKNQDLKKIQQRYIRENERNFSSQRSLLKLDH